MPLYVRVVLLWVCDIGYAYVWCFLGQSLRCEHSLIRKKKSYPFRLSLQHGHIHPKKIFFDISVIRHNLWNNHQCDISLHTAEYELNIHERKLQTLETVSHLWPCKEYQWAEEWIYMQTGKEAFCKHHVNRQPVYYIGQQPTKLIKMLITDTSAWKLFVKSIHCTLYLIYLCGRHSLYKSIRYS